LGIILPTDEFIFFKMVIAPPTSQNILIFIREMEISTPNLWAAWSSSYGIIGYDCG
jgi:hypothetical protein